jgi:hypothetical protein
VLQVDEHARASSIFRRHKNRVRAAARNKQEARSSKQQYSRGMEQTADNWEETMVRTVPLVQAAKEVEINGVRLQYVEQGSGEAMVFVHGAPSDLSHWEPVREGIASMYRFLAYTQRYFGTAPWPDDGKNFSISPACLRAAYARDGARNEGTSWSRSQRGLSRRREPGKRTT